MVPAVIFSQCTALRLRSQGKRPVILKPVWRSSQLLKSSFRWCCCQYHPGKKMGCWCSPPRPRCWWTSAWCCWWTRAWCCWRTCPYSCCCCPRRQCCCWFCGLYRRFALVYGLSLYVFWGSSCPHGGHTEARAYFILFFEQVSARAAK